MRRTLLAALLAMAAAVASCQNSAYGPWPRRTPPGTQREYACRRTARPPVLDGQLDDREWATAPWSEPFVDAANPDGPRPAFETWFKLLWDDRCLYVAALLMEDDVRAAADRGDVPAWTDDDLEILLDRGSGGTAWFEAQVNAKGAIRTLFVERVGSVPAARSWSCVALDGGLQVQGTLNQSSDKDRAWVVELAIPWSCLVPPAGAAWKPGEEPGQPPMIGDELRVECVRRREAPSVDGGTPTRWMWAWTPTWSADPRDPSHWGRIRFTR